jgi:hypothetical protein
MNKGYLIAETLMSVIEDANIRKFSLMNIHGEINNTLRAEFVQYCQESREIFARTGINFSPRMVRDALPQNSWAQKYASGMNTDMSLSEKALSLSVGSEEYHELFLQILENGRQTNHSSLH